MGKVKKNPPNLVQVLSNMKNNQKAMPAGRQGIIQALLVIGILAVLTFIGYILYAQKIQKQQAAVSAIPSPYQVQYQQAGQAVAPIKDTTDLNSASTSLDSADITQLDTHLNALNSASSGF